MARRDDEEFAVFVAASQASLRRTAYLLCGDWQLASDHVQDALIKVFRRWSRLHDDGALIAYARRAVVSVVIDSSRRRSSTETPLAAVVETAATAPNGADELVDRDLMLRCLRTLPARQRACVVLRYYDDLAVSEVAAALGINEGTVKSQTARGLTALKAAYQQATGEEITAGGARA